jgi:hypothetical protein
VENNRGVPNGFGFSGSGSLLCLADTTPLVADEVRTSPLIGTKSLSTLGIDITADRNCTVKVVRFPSGQAGAVSAIGTVNAGEPAFFQYSDLLCPAVKVVVENTGGADMTEYAMHVRGGA